MATAPSGNAPEGAGEAAVVREAAVAAAPAGHPRMEFALAPEDLPALLRLPALQRAGRSAKAELTWHDTPDGAMAGRNQCLCGGDGPWRVEALYPAPGLAWAPGTPPPVLGTAARPDLLNPPAAQPLAAVAAFRGRRHRLVDDAGLAVTVLEGHLRGVSAIRGACRVELHGPAAQVAARAAALGESLHLTVPRASLAAEAAALAQGTNPPARGETLPAVVPGLPLTATVSLVIGGLLDAMLHWSATAGDGQGPIPVHQMRVATRRLRSALSIFKGVAACPGVTPLGPALKATAAALGLARDWDVFLDGTGAQAAALFPDDRRLQALLAAGRRRRTLAYAGLRTHLAGAPFRTLTLSLACAAALRPWEGQDPAQDKLLQADTAGFAAAVLARRMRQVRHAGRGLHGLPVAALHELRKDCKRLRYAAEFFQPLFPERRGRRFIRRLSAVQEALGLLNDGAAAAGLLAQLGRAGEGYAAGLVMGVAAAGGGAVRAEVQVAWRKFRDTHPFWT